MTRFLDGPAEGVTLWLRRAPVFLRAVIEEREFAEWDALDQLGDAPKRTEVVVAYQKVPGSGGWVHLCVRGKNRGAGGPYMTGEYRVCSDQPPDDVMRSTEKWQAWCTEQVAKLTEAPNQ